MLKRFSRALVVVAAVGLAACGGGQAPSQEFSKEDAAAIRQLVASFTDAYNAKDVQKIGSLYSGNAVLMPPNRSTLRGVELLKSYYEARLNEEGASGLVFDDLSLDGHGPLAYIFGTYQVTLNPAGGAEERYRGKCLWVARKLANQWLFDVQMMSSDLPPAAPPAPAPEPEKK